MPSTDDRKRETQLVRSDALALLALLAFALLLTAPTIFHLSGWLWRPDSPYSDLAITHWPNAHFTRRSLWEEGSFPIWRPTLMSGAPFAANPLAGLYYPLNWPFLFLPLLPLSVGFNLSAIFHLTLAGATMYALLRVGLRASPWAGLVSALAYEGAPKLIAHLGAGHVGWTQAWAWLPLIALCWLKALRTERKTRWLWGLSAGATLAIQLCADVRMAAYTLGAGALLLIVELVNSPNRVRKVSTWGISLVVLALLSACQWIPTIALLPDTTRSVMDLRDGAVWSLPWRYLVGLVLADHSGFHEWMTYLGVSTLTFGGVGAWAAWKRDGSGRRRLVVWLGGMSLGAIWFSLGLNGGLFALLWRIVPGLGLLRVPPRAWVLPAFAAPILAGLGFDELKRPGFLHGQWAKLTALAGGTFAPLLVLGYRLAIGPPPANVMMFGIVTPLAVGTLGLGAQIRRWDLEAGRLTAESLLGLVAVLIVAFDLLAVDATLLEVRSTEQVFADGETVANWLTDRPGSFRVYSPSYSVPQHLTEREGLKLADGVDPLQIRPYAHYLTEAAGIDSYKYTVTLPPFPSGGDVDTALANVTPDPEMLGELGVRYVVAEFPIEHSDLEEETQLGETFIYRNEAAHPPRTEPNEIRLSDGTLLYRYTPWPVFVGWGVSGASVFVVSLLLVLIRRA